MPFKSTMDAGMIYDQGTMRPRQRMRPEDVPRFVQWWLQGRMRLWIGRELGLHHHAVSSHGRRLEAQGLLPPGTGGAPVRWDYAADRPVQGELVADERGRIYVRMPPVGVGEVRAGRPLGRKNNATIAREEAARRVAGLPVAAGDDGQIRDGLTWRQRMALRQAGKIADTQEGGEHGDTTDTRDAAAADHTSRSEEGSEGGSAGRLGADDGGGAPEARPHKRRTRRRAGKAAEGHDETT